MLLLRRELFSRMKRISDVASTSTAAASQKKPKMEDAYSSDSEASSSTVFKRIFKTYKKRQPAPDLSNVIDPRLPNQGALCCTSLPVNIQIVSCQNGSVSSDNRSHPSFPGIKDDSDGDSVGLRPLSEWKVVTIPGREGLYILPDLLREDAHLEWLERTFRYAEPPHTTNLTAHGTSPETDVLKNAGKSLRWTTLGVEYDWDTKEYPEKGRALPKELVSVAELVCRALNIKSTKADAAIVNYYPPKATLSPHQDRSERDLSRPLVSLSLGQSAVYLTGGTSLDDPVDALWLRSGDVLVMHAAQRLVYHAVPCIKKTRIFENPGNKYTEELINYANNCRANITIRQVNFNSEA